MFHWIVTVEFFLPYPRHFSYRVMARDQWRAVALARAQFKKPPQTKGRNLSDTSMLFRVEPLGKIRVESQ
jgi:hypothetical protein